MKILICKDTNNQLVTSETKILTSASGVYSIMTVDDIQDKDGYTGEYVWNESKKTFDVVYTKTSTQVLTEQIAFLEYRLAEEAQRSKKIQAEILDLLFGLMI